MRNLQLEKEMVSISREIWPHLRSNKDFPVIESKQGGSTGCYYPSRHTVYFRWNVWNKMPLAGKRLLAIHELYHATGKHHNGTHLFCHTMDILSIELYKMIYDKDEAYDQMIKEIKSMI